MYSWCIALRVVMTNSQMVTPVQPGTLMGVPTKVGGACACAVANIRAISSATCAALNNC